MRLYVAVSCFAASFLSGVSAMAFSFLVPKTLSVACGVVAVLAAVAGLCVTLFGKSGTDKS